MIAAKKKNKSVLKDGIASAYMCTAGRYHFRLGIKEAPSDNLTLEQRPQRGSIQMIICGRA